LTQEPRRSPERGQTERPAPVRERSFPLIALLQLATFLAAVVSCIDGPELARVLAKARGEPLLLVIAPLGACLALGLLGAVIGLGQLRRWRSALVGGGVGGAYGLAMLAVYVAPASLERAVAAAAVLVLTTIAIRIRAA